MSSYPNSSENALPQLSLLVDMQNLKSVLEEAKLLFLDMFDAGDVSPLIAVFANIISLYHGDFIGYKGCDTPYHNLQHTTDVFLAMARLIHGAHVAGIRFSETEVRIALIAALMHDTGYVQKDSESFDSGARLASTHVRRSVDFMKHCLKRNGFSQAQILQSEKLIQCTDHDNALGKISFRSNNQIMLGNMIASADLLAQTADRTYLEKLPLLYLEFKEAGIGNYASELDLIKAAPEFNDQMHERLVNQLDNVKRYLKKHFKVRWHIDDDLYRVAINHSITYLRSVLGSNTKNIRIHFRRALKQAENMSN